MPVAVIILNYYASDDTIRLVRDVIILNPATDFRIIVVDNSCNYDEQAALTSSFKGMDYVETIFTNKNLGYSSGNNIGLRRALELGCEFFLILNPDVKILTKNILDEFVYAIRDSSGSSCSFVGPSVYNPYYNIFQSPLSELSPFRDLVSPKRAEPLVQSYVYSVSGCCIFGITKDFEKLGMFDESFFLYCEEQVIAEKAIKSNANILYYPRIKVEHLHKFEFCGFRKEIKRKNFQILSQMLFLKKYKEYGPLKILVLTLLWYLRALILTVIKFAVAKFKN